MQDVGALACLAMPVDPERVKFVGQPSFDPVPFLDPENKKLASLFRLCGFVVPLTRSQGC